MNCNPGELFQSKFYRAEKTIETMVNCKRSNYALLRTHQGKLISISMPKVKADVNMKES